jgi:hypothetical protein
MTVAGYAQQLLEHGLVRVSAALDPSFCEAVVQDGFARMGIDESRAETWAAGPIHLPVVRNWRFEEAAPRAAAVLHELVGGPEAISFAGIQDNLIVNLPDAAAVPYTPSEWRAGTGWHKDGDWFRHFLDSPEQALLVIVFWRDVVDAQGPTHVAVDSIPGVASLLAGHPEGLLPAELRPHVAEILSGCSDFRAVTGRQGDVVFAHPYLLHRASVNTVAAPRVISNTSVMLRRPMRFDRHDGHTAVERSILDALGVDRLSFEAVGNRAHLQTDRQRRWDATE